MYLLDTSVVSGFVNNASAHHTSATQFIKGAGPVTNLNVSAITVGEMAFGRELLAARVPPPSLIDLAQIDGRLLALQQFGNPLPTTHHVAREYGRLRASYARGVMPHAISAKIKGTHVELWQQKVPGSLLQITENDLWIAAVAVTHDLMLVTADKDFDLVKQQYATLKLHRI